MEMSYELWHRDLVSKMSGNADIFDPHVLVMALQLASLLEDGHPDYDYDHKVLPDGARLMIDKRPVSWWLRAQVQRELEAQP